MTSLALMAQIMASGSLVSWAIVIVVLAGVGALVVLGLRQLGWSPPPFVIQALWIIFVVIVIVFAIIFLARMTGMG